MADDAPTAPGAAGVRQTAASRHDSWSEISASVSSRRGLTMARVEPRGHALDDHQSLDTRGGCVRQSWIPPGMQNLAPASRAEVSRAPLREESRHDQTVPIRGGGPADD